MSSSRRHRTKRPARAGSEKSPKRLLLVVCEGKVTEPEYIACFCQWKRNPRVHVEILDEPGTNPLTLVKAAKKRKQEAIEDAKSTRDENLAYDEFWCVFDVDEHLYIPEAEDMARANEIQLAISNACFELWLLLHFREQPGLQDRKSLGRMLKKYLPDYNKHVADGIVDQYNTAAARAARLDRDAEQDGEPHRNPTTGFYRLTESISKDAVS